MQTPCPTEAVLMLRALFWFCWSTPGSASRTSVGFLHQLKHIGCSDTLQSGPVRFSLVEFSPVYSGPVQFSRVEFGMM